MGRPSSYTPEIAEEICERIAEGESLLQITRCDSMPSKWSVYRWLDEQEDFRTRYARARSLQQDTLADLAREKAELATPDDWQVARLQIDTIKWHAGKVAPGKYGEKTQHTNAAGDGPVEIAVKRVVTDL